MATRLFRTAVATLLWGGVTALASAAAAQPGAAAAESSCITCHREFGSEQVTAFEEDVHRARGFSCVDCHGGDPTTDDMLASMDPARGFKGRLVGMEVIAACSRCHSDAAFMRRFAPRQRVDQESEYATSVHGQQLAGGDLNVATCASCHDAHGIREVADAKSPVFPLNVAQRCAVCHADPAHMAGYVLPDGSALPTDQLAEYMKSEHFIALTRRDDLAAPTCNDCHGNHGAAPPGVGAVANVCGTCHAVFATRFERSPHQDLFSLGCAECHGNHAVLKTTDDMLGASEGSVCITCHGEGDNGLAAATAMRAAIDRLQGAIAHADGMVADVRTSGMEVGEPELALREARTRLTLTRTEVHTADPAIVEAVVTEGLEIVSRIEAAAAAANAELQFRRRGLAVSLVAILLVVLALALKIREIDRRETEGGREPR